MLEKFTEKARRMMFFARYEASSLGSHYIEPEHLLLGLIREDKPVATEFIGPSDAIESMQKQIGDKAYHAEPAASSVDRPLSKASKSVLELAEEERMRLGMANVTTEHVLLGLLQQESLAADILRDRGTTVEAVRQQLENRIASQPVTTRKRTACKDCRHLIVDGELDEIRFNLFCGATPIKPQFDCYTGELKHQREERPRDRYRACIIVNFGDCNLFEEKQESL